MSATKKTRLSDHVADQICNMIQSEYDVNDKLPIESELAQMFSVSRITIREAISKLSYIDVVDVRQGEGTFVKEVELSNFARIVKPFFVIKRQNISDIFEFRLLMETKSAEFAAQRATPDEVKQLRETLEAMDNVLIKEDMESYNTLDAQFHREIACFSHNEVLLSIHDLLYDVFVNTIGISTTPNSLAISVIFHKRIYAAIRDGNSKLAYDTMYTHIADAAKFTIEAVSETPDE